MNIEDLKDQVSEKLQALSNEIQESSAFNTAREKYESLTNEAQRAIQVGLVVALIAFLIYLPWSYFSSSSEAIEGFESNRQSIRELLRASRNSKLPPPLPEPLNPDILIQRINAALGTFGLLDEQKGRMGPLSAQATGSLIQPPLLQSGVEVELKHLNLKQLLDIGHRLQSLSEGLLITGLDMTESKEHPKYFNVVIQLVSIGLPPVESAPEEKPGGFRRGG